MTTNAYELSDDYGMLSYDEIDLIKSSVSPLQKKSLFINIGAGFGTSSLSMLEAKPDSFVFSIDPKPRQSELDNIALAGYGNRVVRLLSKSQDINWPIKIKVDAIFVDGGHTEDDVRRDVEIYKPLVKKGGVMFFHDYGHPNYGPDYLMDKVIDDMMSDWNQIGIARYLVAFKNG